MNLKKVAQSSHHTCFILKSTLTGRYLKRFPLQLDLAEATASGLLESQEGLSAKLFSSICA